MPSSAPQTPAQILARMRSVAPASPRLVRHGTEGRIELSGRVFDNWVAKSSNLLVDELDATDGTLVALDLPVHWKTLALAFACWQAGAVVVLPDDAAFPSADIVLASAPTGSVEPPRMLVCVALGSLAMRWDGPLPRGALDFAAEVRSQGDVFAAEPVDPAADATPLVRTGDRTLTARDLGLLHAPTAGPDPSPTLLLEPGVGLLRTLSAAFDVWSRDGVLVLVEDGVPVTDRLLVGEGVTDQLGSSLPDRGPESRSSS